jgi:hypothetical protein
MEQQPRSQSRSGRGRSRGGTQSSSDTDCAYRSDVSQKGGRRNRKRNRNRGERGAQAQSQAQTQQEDNNAGGLPLGAVDEVGETVNGVTDGTQDLVSNTTGKAVSKPHEALGGLVRNKGKKGQGQEVEEQDEDEDEQLRLRLDLNLDVEVQLKARIHGDLTLGLLYGLTFRCCVSKLRGGDANCVQELNYLLM